jgi:hypothetical protein
MGLNKENAKKQKRIFKFRKVYYLSQMYGFQIEIKNNVLTSKRENPFAIYFYH